MKYISGLIALFLTLASLGSAQVVLPASSDYQDPYNYYRDCVNNNGEEHEALCEQQTGALYPEEEKGVPSEEEALQQGADTRDQDYASANLNRD